MAFKVLAKALQSALKGLNYTNNLKIRDAPLFIKVTDEVVVTLRI